MDRDEKTEASPAAEPVKSNIFFPVCGFFAFCFAVTILIVVTILFANPASSVVQLFDRYGTVLLIVEAILVLGSGFLAMLVDRLRTLNQQTKIREHTSIANESVANEKEQSNAELV